MRGFNENNVTPSSRVNNIQITTTTAYGGISYLPSSISFTETVEPSEFDDIGVPNQQSFKPNVIENNSFGLRNSHSANGANYNFNGNVNILLGSAMLTLISMMLGIVCYCCHRSIKKRREAMYRSQRWLDEDSNMEIYSVEQCYEGSGMFLERSADDRQTTMSLNPQPPPSYDFVLAMEEETQQSQRYSPPPGYMSTNDVSFMANNNHEFAKQSNNIVRTNLGMKRIVDHQSCCSLQRAEVENLLNVAEQDEISFSPTFTANIRDRVAFVGRRSLPMLKAPKTHNPYRRGCSMCGTFRYDVATSSSTDSGQGDFLEAFPHHLEAHGNDADQNGNEITNSTMNEANSSNHCSLHQNSTSNCTYDDNNNNSNRMYTNGDGNITNISVITSPPHNEQTINTNDEENASSTHHTTTIDFATREDEQHENVDLNSINDNGIIRLDMSKIIDKTGLPTYEAALKLESSGYV